MKSLIEAFRYYLQFNRMYSLNTVEAYIGDISQFYEFLEDQHYRLEDISLNHVINFLGYKEHDRSRARVLSSLKHFFYFIEDFEKQSFDFDLSDLRVKVSSIKFPVVLEVDEVENLFKAIDDSHYEPRQAIRDRTIFELLYSCGLRVSELIQLTLDRVDLKDAWINVVGKGNKERVVPIGAILMNQLRYYLDKSLPLYKKVKLGDNFLFLTRLGKPLSRMMVWKLIKQYALLANIKRNIYPHTLRHTFATHLLSNGADLRAVQALLGHTNLSTTKIYTHIKNTELREVIDSYHPFEKK